MRLFLYPAKYAISAILLGLSLTTTPALAEWESADAAILQCNEQSKDAQAEITCLRAVITSLFQAAQPADTEVVTPVNTSIAAMNEGEPQSQTTNEIATPTISPPHENDTPSEALGLGAEQVERKERKKEAKDTRDAASDDKEPANSTVVVDFAYTPTGRLILVMQNGQVWAQRTGDSVKVKLKKGENTPVVIREGMVSGYRIQFTEKRRTITAERYK